MITQETPTLNIKQVSHAFIYQDDRLLLQLRDNRPDIINPNQWGLFGGSIDPGETPAQAIQRELTEELSWTPPEIKYLFTWEEPEHLCTSHIFAAPLTVATSDLNLTEGQALGLFTFEDLTQLPLVPKIPKILPKVVELIASPDLSAAWRAFSA